MTFNGCGENSSATGITSLNGKAYNGSDKRVTRNIIFEDDECQVAFDLACVLDTQPVYINATYEISGDEVIITNDEEKYVFGISDNKIVYQKEESQSQLDESYLADGTEFKSEELTEEELQEIFE